MNIYLLEQDVNDDYDVFTAAVVCAENEEQAITIHPVGYDLFYNGKKDYAWVNSYEDIKCTYLGKADESVKYGVILASFNARQF